ncbi:MAG TPA: SRPBCC family protein [Acidimicrobiales bacterium]
MYHMVQIKVTSLAEASPTSVWQLLADAEGWSRWALHDESSLERPGVSEPDGVGAIRRFRYRRTISREEVVEFDRPRRLSYVLLSGLPIKDYRADVTLTPEGGGTRIDWRSQFKGKIPGTGWLIGRGLQRFLKRTADALAAAAADLDHAR